MKPFFIIIFLLFSCGRNITSRPDELAKYFPTTPMEQLDGRPPILVIGDSISIGYTPFLKEMLPEYQVVHNNENGRGSRFGAYMVDYWAGHSDSWEACIVNHGMWDIITVNEIWYTTAEEYKNNMEFEIGRLKTLCKKIIIPNTTRVPENALYFSKDDLIRNNDILHNIGDAFSVPVCDLYSVSETITHLHLRPEAQDDVHYTEEGYEVLAESLLTCLGGAL